MGEEFALLYVMPRSFLYRGVWNVPFISKSYLVKASVIPEIKANPFSSDYIDSDMVFCSTLRNDVSIQLSSNWLFPINCFDEFSIDLIQSFDFLLRIVQATVAYPIIIHKKWKIKCYFCVGYVFMTWITTFARESSCMSQTWPISDIWKVRKSTRRIASITTCMSCLITDW